MSLNAPSPAMLILAAFARDREALEWAEARAADEWGDIALASGAFDFVETDYYEQAMGAPLTKRFFAFESFIDPARLPALKIQAIEWEGDYKRECDSPLARPLNLDPGYLTAAKLVLATTKDRDHRLYLGEGVYGEVTLHYHHGAWSPRPWTYPDYRRADYHAFFDECRKYLRDRGRAAET